MMPSLPRFASVASPSPARRGSREAFAGSESHAAKALRLPLLLAAALGLLLLAGCATAPKPPPAAAVDEPPPAPREFRGVWVATVANIDWPSKPGLPVAQQRAEMLALLDQARDLRLNAVVFQVRPSADAMYPSPLEPWSEYLTGQQGLAPDPAWDPLAEWIAAAHERGLELHVWLNPYRARHQRAVSPVAPTHLSKTNLEAVKAYGNLLWMDPGEPVAQQRTLDVVRDIVARYDVDGVHIDDYFYPYPIRREALPAPAPAAPRAVANAAAPAPTGEETGNIPFPDDPAWERYRAAGGQLTRADWRRDNVDRLVAAMYRTIHQTKPHVRFGVSPFGLGRPDRRPPGIAGFSQYDQIYANVEHWVEQGWMDYLTPQLYWPRAQTAQAFPVLLDYWAKANAAHGRHLWPGLYTSMVGAPERSWEPGEITGQIEVVRSRPASTGHVHFSMIAIAENRRGLADALRATYADQALVPASPWLRDPVPGAPKLARRGADVVVADVDPAARLFAVWRREADGWKFSVVPARPGVVAAGATGAVVVSAVNRTGVEGPRARVEP